MRIEIEAEGGLRFGKEAWTNSLLSKKSVASAVLQNSRSASSSLKIGTTNFFFLVLFFIQCAFFFINVTSGNYANQCLPDGKRYEKDPTTTRPSYKMVTRFCARVLAVFANNSLAVAERFLALAIRDTVLDEVFVPITVVPLEPDGVGKNPHARSVYGRLYSVKRLYRRG